jgi:hypothetical protein
MAGQADKINKINMYSAGLQMFLKGQWKMAKMDIPIS